MKKEKALVNKNKAYNRTKISNIGYLRLKSPISMQIELTSGCNQKCIFCYNVWKEGCTKTSICETPTREEHNKIIDKIIENEVFDIIFSGGEPLLIPYLEELIERLSKKKIGTMIITNGMLLTKERVKKLKGAGLESIQISLHYFNEEKNDEITGIKGSFKKSVEGIKNVLDIMGKDFLNVNAVIIPETFKDAYKMGEFLNELGVTSFSIGCSSVSGEMANHKDLFVDKEKFLDIYRQLKNVKDDFGIKVSFTGGFPLCILPDIGEAIGLSSNFCDAGLNQLVVSPKGDLRPCVCLGQVVGNIFKDDLKKVWKENKFLKEIRELKYLPKECEDCKHIAICRGGCRASAEGYFNKLNAIDPLMQ
ncbi:MAG: radical SAM protein [archaeon]